MENANNVLAIESWTLYAFGVCCILSRITCRRVTFGSVFKLQLDDWIMVFILLPLTGTIFCANEAYLPSNTAIMESNIIWNRKMRFVFEELQVMTTWLVKACVLVLYQRIFPPSTSKREQRYVTLVSVSCILSYMVIQVGLPLWCYPTHDYWSVSPPNVQCNTYQNHAITALTLGTVTTVATLIIPIPMIPTPRKPLLAFLLLAGILSLVSGILARSFVLVSLNSSASLHWLVAESAAMILFANLPFLSCLYTPKTPSRIRHLNSTLSLSPWPRSHSDLPSLGVPRQRLDSTATASSTVSPGRSFRLGSMTSTIPQADTEDGWNDKDTSLTVPPQLVRKMTLTDPPPELETYWTSRRSSTRGADVESVDVRESQWPLP